MTVSLTMPKVCFAVTAVITTLVLQPVVPTCFAQEPEWVLQEGTEASDRCVGVAVDSTGAFYVCGTTQGNLAGPHEGGADAFLSKYDEEEGELLWTRQIGTAGNEGSAGVALDGLGHIYLVGTTDGDLGSGAHGREDAFVMKFDEEGQVLWTQQLGTSGYDQAAGVAADDLGNLYVVGYSGGTIGDMSFGIFDAYIYKLNDRGDVVWAHQWGTRRSDYYLGVAIDGEGNAVTCGYTYGNLEYPDLPSSFDVIVAKYNSEGDMVWFDQFGSQKTDHGYAISADMDGNFYVTGATEGELDEITGRESSGPVDAFLRKYNAAGEEIWTRQWGTSGTDIGLAVSAVDPGAVYVAGSTMGSLQEEGFRGQEDAFLTKFDIEGNLQWNAQQGSSQIEDASGVVADGTGFAYVVGSTHGQLENDNGLLNEQDLMILKYDVDQ